MKRAILSCICAVVFYACAFAISALAAAAKPGSPKLQLVRNGKSTYRIVLPDSASEFDKKAGSELQKYLRQMSGALLPIVTDTDDLTDSIVWIGSAGHFQKPPFPIDWEKLEEDGFLIKTNGKSLIVAGGRQKGSLYGVYTFLESYLGCRKFSTSVEVVPSRKTIFLNSIDDTEIPKIKFRMENFFEPGYADWHKLDTYKDNWGLFVHTSRVLVPPDKYFKDHPEYFSKVPSGRVPDAQLCLTNPDVFRIVVDGLKERMNEKPSAQFWSVSQNDTYSPCECDSCKQINEAEGSPSGSVLAFVNRVADEFPAKTISTLAYQYSRSAPKNIKPRKNVNIMLCSIECNRSKPLETDPASESFRKDVEDWTKLTGNIFLWDYVIQFRNLVSPFPNFRVLQPNIRFFVKHGITSVFEQGLGSMEGEFAELRIYLIAKLLWNPDINVDSVMNDFLGGYYGKAAPYIRKYIDRMHDALEGSGEPLLIYGYPMPSENGYLSPQNMSAYARYFNQAERAVRSDPELLSRVRIARLPLQFAMLEQAKVYGTREHGFYGKGRDGSWKVKPEMESLLRLFVDRCKRAGISHLEEMDTSPERYLAETEKLLSVGMKKHRALFKPVTLKIPASKKYHDGDRSALTDGLKGSSDYHMNWLGWEGEDMDAVVDLRKAAKVKSIKVDFLQDINSWVFMPLSVEFAVSSDGKDFTPVGFVRNDVPERQAGSFTHTYAADFKSIWTRYIRVKAANMKTCPLWHKGAGGLAWIFADEIVVE